MTQGLAEEMSKRIRSEETKKNRKNNEGVENGGGDNSTPPDKVNRVEGATVAATARMERQL